MVTYLSYRRMDQSVILVETLGQSDEINFTTSPCTVLSNTIYSNTISRFKMYEN